KFDRLLVTAVSGRKWPEVAVRTIGCCSALKTALRC
ncbi:MAG: hypothetical protein ACJARU_000173, partial [Congregibacter sp.]